MIFFTLLLVLITSCSIQSRRSVSSTKKHFNKLYFLSPVARLSKSRISQLYRNKNNKKHEGIDFAGFRGAPITASHSGRIIYAGRKFSGYGRVVLIEYNKKWASLYAHLNSFNVKTGQKITAGQLIGKMGSSGKATGVHLHFELLRFKQPVNPINYLVFNSSLAQK
ncbi:MAG: M23 family metallopeptidase [Bdellovibrionales bacterium]|nr:M23 family metallopeptidase [Bdellovibrionales bacterium]